jgi:hypothetical protein
VRRRAAWRPALAAWFPVIAFLSGCHSYHIDAIIENRSGGAVQLLEVDYPSASFGADALAAGADFHYRFQVDGSGPVTIQYTDAGRKAVKQTGPALADKQEGRLEVVLLPGGKVEFHPEMKPHP